MSVPSVRNNPPTPVQLEIAGLFPLPDRPNWTRSVPLYDSLPKFLFGDTKTVAPGEKIFSLNYSGLVMPDGRVFDFRVTAAIVHVNGTDQLFLPGVREELVARAIRYLSAQELTPMGYYKDMNHGPSFRVTFTLYQIIKLLKNWGHEFNNQEVDQALMILSRTSLMLYTEEQKSRAFFTGSIFADYSGYDGPESGDQRRQVLLNRLEYDAICNGAFHALNVTRVMAHKSALARRLCEFLIHTNRGASKPPKSPAESPPPPCKFSADDVLNYCCIKRLKDAKYTFKRIRAAINELGDAGTLWRRSLPDGSPLYCEEQEILSPGTGRGGRKKIVGVIWSVWLSAETVQEMVASHTEAMAHADTVTGRRDPVLGKMTDTQKVMARKRAKKALA